MNVLNLFEPALRHNGLRITVDDRRMVNLTKIWQSQGAPPHHDPCQWRRRDGRDFVASLAASLGRSPKDIIRTKRGGIGGGGETLAIWQVGLAYARSLSHELHRQVDEAMVGGLL